MTLAGIDPFADNLLHHRQRSVGQAPTRTGAL